MKTLTHESLYTLEHYARIRPEFRAKVMEHKNNRRVALGEHVTLCFEDVLTMQYQVQEMLRLERMFEPELIQEELNVYNPLIPDGHNWKATLMLEYDNVAERRAMLATLIGIERKVWIQIHGFPKVIPIANEDLDREIEDKTSAVHFLRFELTPEMVAAAKAGALISVGVDHPSYQAVVPTLPENVRVSLVVDLV